MFFIHLFIYLFEREKSRYSNTVDMQPELGSGLASRWRLRPTLPGSRVTRIDWRLATLAWRKWRSRKKKSS